jgi:cell division septation protein DedD
MIRDPSDGSVKPPPKRPTSEENWGLKSLAKPERKPQPAPTADELREHYARFNLGFQPKDDPSCTG